MTKLVLIVDDNEDVRMMLQSALCRTGLRVVLAASGDEALEQAEQWHPDLIITDLEMPAGGCDNIRRLRQTAGAIPIVVISGLDARDVESHVLACGGDVFLEKPFELSVLNVAVDRLLLRARGAKGVEQAPQMCVDSL